MRALYPVLETRQTRTGGGRYGGTGAAFDTPPVAEITSSRRSSLFDSHGLIAASSWRMVHGAWSRPTHLQSVEAGCERLIAGDPGVKEFWLYKQSRLAIQLGLRSATGVVRQAYE